MMVMLITMVIFLAVTALVLSGYYAVTAESPAAQRLRRLVPEPTQTQRVQRTEPGAGARLLQRLLAVIGQYNVGRDESSLTKTLSVAGIRSKSAAALFIGVRTLLSVGPGLAVLFSQVSAGKPLPRAVFFAALVWIYGHIMVSYWLKRRARRRIRLMETALPDS